MEAIPQANRTTDKGSLRKRKSKAKPSRKRVSLLPEDLYLQIKDVYLQTGDLHL